MAQAFHATVHENKQSKGRDVPRHPSDAKDSRVKFCAADDDRAPIMFVAPIKQSHVVRDHGQTWSPILSDEERASCRIELDLTPDDFQLGTLPSTCETRALRASEQELKRSTSRKTPRAEDCSAGAQLIPSGCGLPSSTRRERRGRPGARLLLRHL